MRHMTNVFNQSTTLLACIAVAAIAQPPADVLAQVPPSSLPPDVADENLLMSPEDAIALAFSQVEEMENDPVILATPRGMEKFEQATRLANFILVREPLNKTAGYILGRLALLAGRPREAMPAIESYIGTKERPGPGFSDWYARTLLGDIRLVSYPQLALPEFQKAEELAPDEPKAVIGLAEAYLKLNRAVDATDKARRAIQLDQGRDPEYRVVLARSLLLSQKYDEAAVAAREAIALGEVKAQASAGKLELLQNLERYYQLHQDCIQNLMAQFPDSPEYVLELAQTWQDRADLARLVEYHAVLRALEATHEFESFRPTSELLLEEANLNRIVGRNAIAIEILQRILEESPGFKPAVEMLDMLQPKTQAAESADAATSPELNQ